MSFRRTPAGISNQHLFSKVEAVVFVEGGRSLTQAEIQKGVYNEQALDVAFWRRLFSTFVPNKKVKIKAIGSKASVCLIADDIRTGKIKNAYAAMDRDFDLQKGLIKTHPGIFYSHGYSWENDVWRPTVIREVFFRLCPLCPINHGARVGKEIKKHFEEFARSLKWVVYADYILNVNNLPFDDFRRKPESVVVAGANGIPYVNVARLKTLIRTAKTARKAPLTAPKKRLDPYNDCQGHVYGNFGYRLLSYLLKNFCQDSPSLPKLFAQTATIDTFGGAIGSYAFRKIFNYYKRQFAAI